MSEFVREDLREAQMQAADAQRLASDPTLWEVFKAIRAQALNAVVYGPDERDRAQSRALVVAIDMLATELQTRIDAVRNLAEVQRRAKAFE